MAQQETSGIDENAKKRVLRMNTPPRCWCGNPCEPSQPSGNRGFWRCSTKDCEFIKWIPKKKEQKSNTVEKPKAVSNNSSLSNPEAIIGNMECLRNKLLAAESKLEETNALLKKERQNHQRLQNQSDDFKNEKIKEIRALSEKIKAGENEEVKKSNEIGVLTKSLEEVKMKLKSCECDSLKTKLSQTETLVQALKEELSVKDENLNRVIKELDTLKTAEAFDSSRSCELEIQVGKLGDDLKQLHEKNKCLIAALANAESLVEKNKQTENELKDSISQQRAAMEKQVQIEKSKIGRLEMELNRLKSTLEIKEREINHLKEDIVLKATAEEFLRQKLENGQPLLDDFNSVMREEMRVMKETFEALLKSERLKSKRQARVSSMEMQQVLEKHQIEIAKFEKAKGRLEAEVNAYKEELANTQ